MCASVAAPRKVGHHGGTAVSWSPAVAAVLGALGWSFQATRDSTIHAPFSGTCVITPKGLRELFILRVVPAVKFDWLAYKGEAATVGSLSLESPSSVLQKSGLGRAGLGQLGRCSGRTRGFGVLATNESGENGLQTL